jgi:hypothetical protein
MITRENIKTKSWKIKYQYIREGLPDDREEDEVCL